MSVRWPQLHILTAPWGVFLATLVYMDLNGSSNFHDMVDMGTLIYAMCMSISEGMILMVFFAAELILKRVKQRREERRESDRRLVIRALELKNRNLDDSDIVDRVLTEQKG